MQPKQHDKLYLSLECRTFFRSKNVLYLQGLARGVHTLLIKADHCQVNLCNLQYGGVFKSVPVAGSSEILHFIKDWFSPATVGTELATAKDDRKQQICCSLWLHNPITSVCVFTLTNRRGRLNFGSAVTAFGPRFIQPLKFGFSCLLQ